MQNDLQEKLQKLQDLRDLLGEEVYAQNVEKLRAQYGSAALDKALSDIPNSQHTQNIGGNAQVGVAIAGNHTGNVYLDGRRADKATQLLAEYLQRLRTRCAVIPLEGMRQQKQVDDLLSIGLDQVYTQVTVEGQVQREVFHSTQLHTLDIKAYFSQHVGDHLLPSQRRSHLQRPMTSEERSRPNRNARVHGMPVSGVEADEILFIIIQQLDKLDHTEFRKILPLINNVEFFGPRLASDAIADEQRLVLLGEPGSGKSTILRYLALTLAEASLDKSFDLTARLAGWERVDGSGRLLPIFLPLLPFARQMANIPHRTGNADDLWNYIADQLEPGNLRTGLAEAVHAELTAGRVLLLLDGLDEVASSDSRQQVVRAVQQFASEHQQCRIVVTCRVRAYEGSQNAAWQLPGWPSATLQEWNQAQMQHFIAAWYAAAMKAGALPQTQLNNRIEALQRAVAASSDLQRLATRPLLLTIMALVHLNDGRLPEDRVTLYSRCIDILLSQWEIRGKEETVYGSLMSYIGLPDRDVQRLRPLLTQAAFKAHMASTADSPGSLGRETLRMMAGDYLEQLGHSNPHEGAKRFLEYTDLRAGLIQASDAGDAYVFPHLTFQEYLAGLELVSGIGVVNRIMQHRMDDRWRVPILLGVGDYVSGNKLEIPYQLLNVLLLPDEKDSVQYQRNLLFAAEIGSDVGWERLEQGGKAFSKLRRDLAQALTEVVGGTTLPATERVQAGILLGQLGDPRPGVCTLPPAMIQIKGRIFEMGDNGEGGLQTIETFEISRYPVTNAQFKLFLDEDGYNPNQPWWNAEGLTWLKQKQLTEPEYWQDQRFGVNLPNHPVVGITLYEALAFCSWLTSKLNDGFVYTLPSEAEWKYAAHRSERRIYPWGNQKPNDEHANFDLKYDGTTAVGCFPVGATPEGVFDLAGNVFEWTRSEDTIHRYNQPDEGENQIPAELVGKYFIACGGSWSSSFLILRTITTSSSSPEFSLDFKGFRVIRRKASDLTK